MGFHTTTARNLLAGARVLTSMAGGRFYKTVKTVEAITDEQHDWERTYVITFDDGSTMTRKGFEAIHYNTEA